MFNRYVVFESPAHGEGHLQDPAREKASLHRNLHRLQGPKGEKVLSFIDHRLQDKRKFIGKLVAYIWEKKRVLNITAAGAVARKFGHIGNR